MWDCETYPDDIKVIRMYNVGFTKDKRRFEEDEDFYQSLFEDTTVFYGESSLERFENWLLDKSEEVRRKVDKELDAWTKRSHKSNANNFESRKKSKITELVNNYKVIMEAFCCDSFYCQIIWKSKRLQFENIINSFGILYLSLKGGYVEFKGVARITGSGRTLDSICKSFKLPPNIQKVRFLTTL